MDLRTQVQRNIQKSNTFLGLPEDFFPLEKNILSIKVGLEKGLLQSKKSYSDEKKSYSDQKSPTPMKKFLIRSKKIHLQ